MMYYLRFKDGQRWKVREAVSLKAALNGIAHATVTGSIGDKLTIDERLCGGGIRIISDVIQVNSDNTEREPYSQGY